MILFLTDNFQQNTLITAELERLRKLMKLIPAKVNSYYFKEEMTNY
jgi:hypothetical protein